MAIQPYEQGHLDYYCGLYSITNALKLMNKRIRGEEAMVLFRKIIRFLEKRRKLSLVSARGMLPNELQLILRKVVSEDYGIVATRPFARNGRPRINKLFRQIREFLEQGSGRAVIVSLGGDDEDDGLNHWSVIQRVSRKQLHFFDSTSINKVNREKCTTAFPTTERPYSINPAEVFFLWQATTNRKEK